MKMMLSVSERMYLMHEIIPQITGNVQNVLQPLDDLRRALMFSSAECARFKVRFPGELDAMFDSWPQERLGLVPNQGIVQPGNVAWPPEHADDQVEVQVDPGVVKHVARWLEALNTREDPATRERGRDFPPRYMGLYQKFVMAPTVERPIEIAKKRRG